jgi:glutamate/tyrosine decarboxylase-like PLP-dependent enzyme
MDRFDSMFRASLETAFDQALEYLEGLNQRPVGARVDAATLRDRLNRGLTEEGVAPERVISELAADVEGGLVGSSGGRFFAWVIGGSLPAALAADWLTSTWDQNAVLYAASPAAAVVEEVVGAWLKEILGLPSAASFALVSGCQMAHATCLAAARQALLAERGWSVEERGMYGAPPIRIISSDQRHGSFERALRLLGLGQSCVQYLRAGPQGALPADALERALEEGPPAPTFVLLQAGEINTGAFDSFQELVPISRRYGAWVHVDGAFGLWAAASGQYRHLLDGVAMADSWATDGHKWLNVPFDCGYAFILNAAAHRAVMSYRAPYLTHAADVRDEMDWNPEWSRRARGFPTYAALRQLGRAGLASLVENCCRHAHSLVTRIGGLRGAEVVREPTLNQGLVRFLDMKLQASEEDHDRRTDEVIAAIVASGEAFFGGTSWRGRRAMRVSVCSWRTSDEDVDRVVDWFSRMLNSAGPVRDGGSPVPRVND